MKTILIIARKEFQMAFRSRLFLTIALMFLGLSVLSVVIGSTTKRAEMRLYQERVATLTAEGATTLPAAPEIYTLTILSNLTEYVAIVGAILGIVLGYNALIAEKESGGLKLILTRPVYRDHLLMGKFLGNGSVIALLLGLAFISNLTLLVAVGGIIPTPGEVMRLMVLIGMAFAYISIFLIVSMVLSIFMKSSASVLLVSLVMWILVSFVIPQMADTQMANSTVVNSINGATNQIPQETSLSRAINSTSPTWHLRQIGAELLQVAPGSAAFDIGRLLGDSLGVLFILLVPCVVGAAIGFTVFLRSDTLALEENGI